MALATTTKEARKVIMKVNVMVRLLLAFILFALLFGSCTTQGLPLKSLSDIHGLNDEMKIGALPVLVWDSQVSAHKEAEIIWNLRGDSVDDRNVNGYGTTTDQARSLRRKLRR